MQKILRSEISVKNLRGKSHKKWGQVVACRYFRIGFFYYNRLIRLENIRLNKDWLNVVIKDL